MDEVIVGIIHHSLNPLGGAERLCVATIEALKEQGWKVVLATTDQTNWKKVYSLWGKVTRPDKEIVFSVPFKGFTIYKRILTSALVPKLFKEVDVVINTHGDVLVTNADITYMHFPTFQLMDAGYSKYSHGFWRLYFTPYYILQNYLSRKQLNTLLLTNSRFSASVIKRVLSREAIIIYPPVNIEKYLRLEGKREDIVVSIGRFSPEKRYEFILRVAKKLPNIQFYIIGSIANKRESQQYYRKIKEKIELEDLKNVVLKPNASDKEIMEIMSISKVILHSRLYEHFGMAIVEGMAAGLVPVIHRSGGAWTDIIEYGKYGFGYISLNEAIKYIEKALKDYYKFNKIVRKRSTLFNKNKYKQRITYVVKKYVELSK